MSPRWQRLINDAPDDVNGGDDESSGDSSDDDKEDDGWEEDDGDEDAGDDLSATIVPTCSRQSSGQGGHDNSAQNSFQANPHQSVTRTPTLCYTVPLQIGVPPANVTDPKRKSQPLLSSRTQ